MYFFVRWYFHTFHPLLLKFSLSENDKLLIKRPMRFLGFESRPVRIAREVRENERRELEIAESAGA